ncbi:SRPBCC family protein [Alteromonas sp. ASW11-130]|uniref:SRPBCC family protein n=1 Tax=Alteromonas sp. ASW11-130 TaxID=3015775 RepID=UPI0022428CB2|nr:SRPBCC domain-containing protein [Alteromonas sp. ASW11-130]MCW8091710.1 SRPBCC domain-containing protein [Alteromonas sp. ASW11-130]
MYNFKMNVIFHIPITQLFDAFHKPELISQWIAPPPMHVVQVVSDFEEGGQYRIVMEEATGKSYTLTGEYTRIRRNDQLMFSWAWEDALEESVITSVDIQFEQLNDSTTEIILIHSGFANEKEKEQHNLGWIGCLEKLSTIRFH